MNKKNKKNVVKDLNNQNKKNDDKITKILLIIFAITTIIFISVLICFHNRLNPSDKRVEGVYNYFNFKTIGTCEGQLNYTDKKITYKDVSLETKNCIAYQNANIPKDKIVTETYEGTKKKETCTHDGMVFRKNADSNECVVNKIEKEYLEKSYKKIFGKDLEDSEMFYTDNLNICYLKDDYYYCGLAETYTLIFANPSSINRVIDKVYKKGSSMIVYDYFLKIEADKCYTNYTTTEADSDCSSEYAKNKKEDIKFIRKYGTYYKHTYKKAADGSYYWVSSEPVK